MDSLPGGAVRCSTRILWVSTTYWHAWKSSRRNTGPICGLPRHYCAGWLRRGINSTVRLIFTLMHVRTLVGLVCLVASAQTSIVIQVRTAVLAGDLNAARQEAKRFRD